MAKKRKAKIVSNKINVGDRVEILDCYHKNEYHLHCVGEVENIHYGKYKVNWEEMTYPGAYRPIYCWATKVKKI